MCAAQLLVVLCSRKTEGLRGSAGAASRGRQLSHGMAARCAIGPPGRVALGAWPSGERSGSDHVAAASGARRAAAGAGRLPRVQKGLRQLLATEPDSDSESV